MDQSEYAVTSTSAGRLIFPTVEGRSLNCDSSNLALTSAGAAGEAAFMTGLERNSDIVYALLYFFWNLN